MPGGDDGERVAGVAGAVDIAGAVDVAGWLAGWLAGWRSASAH